MGIKLQRLSDLLLEVERDEQRRGEQPRIAPRLVYVAGPYSGSGSWEREQNIRRAEQVCLELWARGVPAVCVHTAARFFYGAIPERLAVEIDNAILDRCDAMVLVSGWSRSSGTVDEIRRCEAAGRPVFCSVADCVAWAFGEEAA